MERALGGNFADVRIHADSGSGGQAVAQNSRASTQDGRIFFAPGYFQPSTPQGRALLAHELTHVVQQRQQRFQPGRSSAATRLALEREAGDAEARVGERISSVPRVPVTAAVAQFSLLEDFEARALGNVERIADWALAHASSDPKLQQLSALRRKFAGVRVVHLPPGTLAGL